MLYALTLQQSLLVSRWKEVDAPKSSTRTSKFSAFPAEMAS